MSGAGWRETLIAWRNRLLSDVRFQRFAADFPLTRPIAARRTQALFDIVAGFVYSQTLAACVRLDLFAVLSAAPRSTAAIAALGSLPTDAARRLLDAAAALKLIDRLSDDRWGLGSHGAALIANPGLLEMIAHHDQLYADLQDSLGLLRSGRGELAQFWPYATSLRPAGAPADGVAAYSSLMAATQPAVAADLLSAYPVRRHQRLLDVGGGEGVFLTEAGRRTPNLRLMLFDLPAVAARARDRLTAAGLSDRAEIAEGDFHADPLPTGADLVTLIRILHDQNDQGVDRLLRSVRTALPPKGVLLIAEPMGAPQGADRVADVYFAFYLLAMGRGRARTPQDLAARLRGAGFNRVRSLRTRTPSLLRAIAASP